MYGLFWVVRTFPGRAPARSVAHILPPMGASKVAMLAGKGIAKLRSQIALQAASRGRARARRSARNERLRAMQSGSSGISHLGVLRNVFKVGTGKASAKLGMLAMRARASGRDKG